MTLCIFYLLFLYGGGAEVWNEQDKYKKKDFHCYNVQNSGFQSFSSECPVYRKVMPTLSFPGYMFLFSSLTQIPEYDNNIKIHVDSGWIQHFTILKLFYHAVFSCLSESASKQGEVHQR